MKMIIEPMAIENEDQLRQAAPRALKRGDPGASVAAEERHGAAAGG
jgi:hypothetical protein